MLSKRTLAGSLLFLLLVGELTVGAYNGLFTPGGLVVLLLLYWTYFMMFDALAWRYRLTNLGLVLMNFALYSVLITGLLHGELSDFVTRPRGAWVTLLIRVQCSLFPLFAYALIGRPKQGSVIRSIGVFMAFVVGVTLVTPGFGLRRLAVTLQTAPVISLLFIVLAVLAWFVGVRSQAGASGRRPAKVWAIVLLAVSLIPGPIPFFSLLGLMVVFAAWLLANPAFRNAPA